jgi:hypothetical protein
VKRTSGIEYESLSLFGIWSKSYVRKNSNTIVFGSVGGVLIPANSVLTHFILQPLASVRNFIIQANYGAAEKIGMEVDGEILSIPGITDGGGKNIDQKFPTMAFTDLKITTITAVTLTGFLGILEIAPNV